MITNPSKALAKSGPRACSLWITFYCSELPNQGRMPDSFTAKLRIIFSSLPSSTNQPPLQKKDKAVSNAPTKRFLYYQQDPKEFSWCLLLHPTINPKRIEPLNSLFPPCHKHSVAWLELDAWFICARYTASHLQSHGAGKQSSRVTLHNGVQYCAITLLRFLLQLLLLKQSGHNNTCDITSNSPILSLTQDLKSFFSTHIT